MNGYDVERVLFSADDIAKAVRRLAHEIARDYSGRSLLLLGVLKGALYVTVDLAREISGIPDGPSEVELDFLAVSSYGQQTRSSGEVRLLKDAAARIAGRHVVIVEDIIDNGLTLQYLRALLGGRGPATLRSCVLFDKPYHRLVDVPVDYRGLTAPDEFIVGYGLDFKEGYRNLPFVAQLRPSVLQEV